MPSIEPIAADRLILRDFVGEDWPAVHRYGADSDVVRYLAVPPNTERRSREFVEERVSDQSAAPRLRYGLAITLARSGELIGGAGLRLVSPTQREASIGYVLRRDCWGRGYATEAGKGLLRFGFERIKAHRIFASCDVEHVRSIRVLEKLGMTREGRHRQDTWYPSSVSWRDSYYYAILEDEWIGRQ